MATMQTTGSQPTWANGSDAAAAATTASTHTLQTVTGADVANDSLKKPKSKDKKAKRDREPDPGLAPRDERSVTREEKKRKRSKPEGETEAGGVPTSRNYTTTKDEDISHSGAKATHKKAKKKEQRKSSKEAKGGDESLDDASGLNEEDADRIQLEDTRTDGDWLRARTNRVLDLVDVQEVPTKESEHAVSEGNNNSSSGSYHEAEPYMTAPSHVVQHGLEESLANGRLFIRNLPYSVDEADVKNLFSKYGKVDEVSRRALFFVSLFSVMIS